MIGRPKPWGINVFALLISIGGVMDLQNFLWFFIDPTNLLFASIDALKWFNFYLSLPVGTLSLIVGFTFVKGVSWGRSLGVVSAFLGILINIINLIISRTFSPIIVIITLINAVTIYYVRTPAVKKYFASLLKTHSLCELRHVRAMLVARALCLLLN